MEKIKTVFLKGNYYQIGYQHGKILKEEIKEIIEKLREIIFYHEGKKRGKFTYEILKLTTIYLNYFLKKEFKEELKGISEGADVDYKLILLENFLEEIAEWYFSSKIRKILPFKCSAFVVKENDQILAGRNLDYSEAMPPANILFVYYPENSNPFVSLSWPGNIGAFTSFSNYLSIFLLSSPLKKKYLKGKPWEIFTREIIQKDNSLDSAIKEILREKIFLGQNIVLVSEENAAVVEYSPYKKAIRELKDQLIVTNHFEDKEMSLLQEGLQEEKPLYTEVPEDWFTLSGSKKRFKKIEELLKEKPITLEKAKDILGQISTKGTLQSIVFLPKEKELHIAFNSKPPVTLGEWLKINLKDLI